MSEGEREGDSKEWRKRRKRLLQDSKSVGTGNCRKGRREGEQKNGGEGEARRRGGVRGDDKTVGEESEGTGISRKGRTKRTEEAGRAEEWLRRGAKSRERGRREEIRIHRLKERKKVREHESERKGRRQRGKRREGHETSVKKSKIKEGNEE